MGSEAGFGWRAKWSDRDLDENAKIIKLFDRFPQWFLMALRDVISMVTNDMGTNGMGTAMGSQAIGSQAIGSQADFIVGPLHNVFKPISWAKPI